MIRQDPILITAPPRSGTTMLAGLIHYHGVWIGRSRTTMYPGTNSNFGSENIDIKSLFKNIATVHGYQNWNTPFPVLGTPENLQDAIEGYVPEDTPWLVKTAWCLLFHKFWTEAYPNAKWVFPMRDPVKIMDSMNRHPGMRLHVDEEKSQYISHLLQAMSDVIDTKVNYIRVDMEALVDRDPDTIKDLFDFLEMKIDRDVIKDWIKPEMFKR